MKTKFSSKKLMASLLVAILSLSIVGVNIFGSALGTNGDLYSGYIKGNTTLGGNLTLTDPAARDLYNDLIFTSGAPGSASGSGYGSFYNYQVAGLVPRWAVGVGVNIKIFDGLNREYKYSAAKQTVRRVGALQNKAGKDISVLVEKLYNQMMNYHNQMTSIDASLKFAEEYLRMKNAAFLEGMSSSSDLIDAELNLAGVRTERLQAAYNYDLLLARLLEAAGISDEFPAYSRRSDARVILFDEK